MVHEKNAQIVVTNFVNIQHIEIHLKKTHMIGWGGNPQEILICRDWSLISDTNCENIFMPPPKPDELGIFKKKKYV